MARREVIAFAVLLGCGSARDPDAEEDSSTGADDPTTDPTTDPGTTAPSTTATTTSASTSTTAADPTTDPTEDPSDTTTDSDDSTDESGDAPIGCFDYDSFAPSVVSFRVDVMPILAASCSQCHADESASIYFGQGGTSEGEAAATYAKLLTGEPKQAPHLAFVEPGDPLHSYMLAKVEYTNPGGTCSEVVCSEPGCELPAPPAGPLADGEKAILRSWIIGGALDD